MTEGSAPLRLCRLAAARCSHPSAALAAPAFRMSAGPQGWSPIVRLGSLAPWGVSLGLHALLLGTVLLFGSSGPAIGPPPEPAIISFYEPAPGGVQLVETVETLKPIVKTVPTPTQDVVTDQSLASTVARMLPPVPQVGPTPTAPDSPQAGLDLTMPNVTFAGLGSGSAASVVYIVDGSGSMVSAMPLVAGELKRSLRQLAPAQRFAVIVFRNYRDTDYIMAPGGTGGLMRATGANVARVSAWLDTVVPGGRSNPIPALRLASEMKADAVFVLSKSITGIGEWEPDKDAFLAELDRLNPRDTRNGKRRMTIKTIQFLDRDPAGLLEAVGRLHGGEDGFNFISREELRLR